VDATASAFPYPLVDRVLHVEPGVRAVGMKLVSANEPFFAGHFPNAPVMPGVLICEALVQLGAHCIAGGRPLRLTAVKRARFRRPVLPGDALALEVVRAADAAGGFVGVVEADGAVVAEVEFTAEIARVPRIHPTAAVAAGAELAPDVEVGPYAVVGPHVRIGPGSWLGPHAVVEGRTTLGARTRVFQFASVGAPPQDLKYRGEPSTLELGDDNTIREYVTLQPGTAGGGLVTRIGSGCLFMASAHVGHDCRVGDHVILANGAALGGHVVVEDHAIVGALAGVHQFVRIGESALCAAGAMVSLDVPPFCIAAGDRARLYGLNTVGLRRRGISRESRAALKHAYRLLFQGDQSWRRRIDAVRSELGGVPEVARLLAFLGGSQRGVCH
jgi:UDP-N-acetylglucosamine acyltransferase